jgi:DHA1 family inner membrane transport protein
VLGGAALTAGWGYPAIPLVGALMAALGLVMIVTMSLRAKRRALVVEGDGLVSSS